MKFVSTRGGGEAVTISTAIRNGAAPDGGLYVPVERVSADFTSADTALPALGETLIAPFFAGDALAPQLGAICNEAFNFPAPVVTPDPAKPGLRLLELFHGPTGAFKDFGARFLMACFERIGDPAQPLTVLAATSGDTGGAVGCAAEGRQAVRSVILFPKGRVSPFQRLQLCCWNDPAISLEVDGDFDACQRIAKAAFADPALSARHRLTSANSINIARLLPQAVYWTAAALQLKAETGTEPGLIIPTGNMGHVFAALLARSLGAPIGPVVAVTNANRTLYEWQQSGRYEARPSIATIANAMDVGNPSNFERLASLPDGSRAIRVELVDDDTIRARITSEYRASGYVWDPHGATAAEAYARLSDAERAKRSWIAGGTAHPYKFAEVVEPLIGRTIEPPPALAALLGREAHAIAVAPTLEAVAAILDREAAEAA